MRRALAVALAPVRVIKNRFLVLLDFDRVAPQRLLRLIALGREIGPRLGLVERDRVVDAVPFDQRNTLRSFRALDVNDTAVQGAQRMAAVLLNRLADRGKITGLRSERSPMPVNWTEGICSSTRIQSFTVLAETFWVITNTRPPSAFSRKERSWPCSCST